MTAALPQLHDTRSRWQRVGGPMLLAGGLLGASLLLHLRDPHRSGSWGGCPWLFVTGTYCPGCGGLRAVNDLTNGEVGAAASSNLLFVGSLPFVAFWWTRSTLARWRGTQRAVSTRQIVVPALVFSAVALAFWVVRNLPSGAWLTP
jgi:hypothetical protein